MSRVPLFDPTRRHARDRVAIRAAIDEVLDGGRYVLGPAVERFEAALAGYLGAAHVVGVASGSDALELALRGLGVARGHAVVTTAFTFVATAEAIVHAGATPVFADVRASDWLLDVDALDDWLSGLAQGDDGLRRLPSGERVRAVVLVHLFGAVHDDEDIRRLQERHGVFVVEDAAQALGGTSGERRAGAMSDAGCFSFFPSKTLGGLGDGGAIATPHATLADQLRALRQHGMARRGHPEHVGRNSRLDAVQAAALAVKLAHLDEDVAARRAILRRYEQALRGATGLVTLSSPIPPGHAGQCAIVRAPRREETQRRLADAGIDSAVYYDEIVAELAPYRDFPRTSGLEVAREAARSSLALPVFPGMTEDEITRVVAALGA